MDDYRIRNVTPGDFSFLADMIIGAEKGNSGKLSCVTLFSMEENNVKEFIIAMLQEDIDGCEFSPSSYLIADYNGIPVAALGAWIERYNGNLSSRILKSNLLSFLMEENQIESIKSKADIIRDIVIERQRMTLQFEYLYVVKEHRGRSLHIRLMNSHLANVFSACPELTIAQAQVYKNNLTAIKVYEEVGFRKVSSSKLFKNEIIEYNDYEKILMEINLNLTSYGKK